jgi:hypothetical protein
VHHACDSLNTNYNLWKLNLEKVLGSEGRGTEQQVGIWLQDRRTLGSVMFSWPEETTEECLVVSRSYGQSSEYVQDLICPYWTTQNLNCQTTDSTGGLTYSNTFHITNRQKDRQTTKGTKLSESMKITNTKFY